MKVKIKLLHFHVSDTHVAFRFNPKLPLHQQLALLLPGDCACRPDLIPNDQARWTLSRRYPRLRLVWDLCELTHQQKPSFRSLPARLGPAKVHPTSWGVGLPLVLSCYRNTFGSPVLNRLGNHVEGPMGHVKYDSLPSKCCVRYSIVPRSIVGLHNTTCV